MMTTSQREAFLEDLHVGVISIARTGAPPLAAPVWYTYEPDGDVVFVFESDSEKVRRLEVAGEASLCVQNESMPYMYVTVEGPVVLGATDDDVERLLAHRYLGEEIGDMYLETTASTVSRVVRLTPARWRTVDYTSMVDKVLGAGAP